MTSLGAEYQPLASTIHLETADGTDDARALEVWNELRPVVEPLALTLLLGYYEVETGVRADVDPDASVWQLIELGLPDRIRIDRPDVTGVERRTVPTLDRLEIVSWVERALDQRSPMAGLEVGLASLHCDYVRAAVYGVDPTATSFRLVHPEGVLDLPLERRGQRTFVLAPTDGLHFYPPVGWSVKRAGDSLRADISINWSEWLELGRPEGLGVQSAAQRLRDRGWLLAEPVYPLGLVP